jgi:O-antigen/teichoic acid export membrane protein
VIAQLRQLLAAARVDGMAPNAAGTLALRSAYVGLELLCGLALARTFGSAAYGAYAFTMACVGMLAIPGAAGFDRLAIREVAALTARQQSALVRGVLRRGGQFALAASCVLALVMAGIAWLADTDESLEHTLWAGALLIPIVATARVRQAGLQGLGRVVLGQVPELLVQPLLLLALVGLIQLLPVFQPLGVVAMGLQLIAASIACALGIIFLRRSLPASVTNSRPEFRTAQWINSAIPFVWMLGMNVIVTNVDTFLLGVLDSASSAGFYRVASQLAMLVVFPLTAINMAFAPVIASLYASGEIDSLRRRARLASRLALLAAAPIALGLLLVGKYALQLFGPDFAVAYPALVILTVGYFINAMTGTAGYVLIMTRHEGSAAMIFGAAASINVAGNLLLIPRFGLTGAAIATAVSIAVTSVGLVVMARRHLAP